MSFQTVRFGDLVDNFDNFRRPVKTTDREPGPFPYYGASGVIDHVAGFTHDGEYLLVAEDGENLRSRNTPVAFLASTRFWANNHVHVVRGRAGTDTRFLSMLLSVTDISSYITGTTLPKLSRSAMDSIVVSVPSSSTQVAIADVVQTLDEKISANTRAISTAHGLCKALVGQISERVALGERVRISRVVSDPVDIGESAVWHYSLPAYDQGQLAVFEPSAGIKSIKFVVDEPAVLVSKLNPRFPRIWDVPRLLPGRSVASTEFVVLTSPDFSSTVLWAVLAQPSFAEALEGKAAGTSGSHQRVKPDDLLATDVVDPRAVPTVVREQLAEIGRLVDQLRRESRSLLLLRRTLLPGLMSGRLRVKDAEKQVEAVV